MYETSLGRAAVIFAALVLLSPLQAHAQASWPILSPAAILTPTDEEIFPHGVANGPVMLEFGSAIASSRDSALIGMPYYAYGDPPFPDDKYADGAVAVFSRAGGSWQRSGTLLPTDPANSDFFGEGVALRRDTAAVQATSGVYVFQRGPDGWREVQKLTPPPGVRFDGGLAIRERTLFIGAPAYGAPGAVYAFRPDSQGTWRLEQTLVSGEGADSDLFGARIEPAGDGLAIGAPGDSGNRGAVFFFHRQGRKWVVREKLIANDVQDGAEFGAALAASGGRMAIGALFTDKAPPNCGPEGFVGAVYVFTRTAGQWTQQEKIPTPQPCGGTMYGQDVALGHGRLVAATTSEFPYYVGEAYVYSRSPSAYVPEGAAPDTSATSTPVLALSGSTLLVGLQSDRLFSVGMVEVFDLATR